MSRSVHGQLRPRADRRANAAANRTLEPVHQLSRQIKQAGLLDRRQGYYAAKMGLNFVLLAAEGAALLLLGDSWWQLGTAAYLAVVSPRSTSSVTTPATGRSSAAGAPMTWPAWCRPTC
jgi:hypothetical protein